MHELLNAFCFFDPAALSGAAADADRYASIVGWAGRARGTNPNAFDAMTDLLLDDAAEAFASARTLHFELEDIYVAARDFEKAGRLRDALINEIF